MNIPKIIKAFGQIDDKFLLEAEKAERLSPVRFRLESVLLAAVISVVALGITAFAISRAGGLDMMKYAFDRYSGLTKETEPLEESTSPEATDLTPNIENDYTYFEKYGEEIPNPEEFPWLNSLYGYGTEIEYGDEKLEPGEMRSVAILCDENHFYAVMQYSMSNDVLSAISEIPNGKTPEFKYCHYESDAGGAYESTMPISVEDNIYTFVTYSLGFTSLPDEVKITFSEFGYKNSNSLLDFVTMSDIEVEVTVSTINSIKSETLISREEKYSTQFGEARISAELSPFGILFRVTGDNEQSATVIYDDKYFGTPNMQIFLEDGRVYGNGETYWALSYIIKGKTGWIDDGVEKKIYYISLPFTKPVDISQINRITVYDTEFSFKKEY